MTDKESTGTGSNDRSNTPEHDGRLLAFLACLRTLGIALDEREVRRRTGRHEPFRDDHLMEAAEACGLKAQHIRSPHARGLARLPVPCIAMLAGERALVVVEIAAGDGALLLDVATNEQFRMAPAEMLTVLGSGLFVFRRYRHGEDDAGPQRFGFGSLLPRLLHYRGSLIQLMSASLILQIFNLATPLFTMVIIDKVLSTGALDTLDVLILALAAIAIFDLSIALLRGALFADVTNRLDVELVAGVFGHLSRLPMSYFGSRRTGESVARVRELENVRQFLTGPTLTAIVDFVFAFVFLGIMYLFSPKLTLIVVLAIVAMLGLYALLAPILKRRLERRFSMTADNQSFLVDALTGMETVKSLSIEPQMQREWEERSVAQSRISCESERLNGNLSQVAQFLSKGTVALTLWLGAQAVIAGDLTAGQLIAFNMMVGRVMAPALRLAQLFQQLSQTRVSIRRLADIFDVPTEPQPRSESTSLPRIRGGVRFEYVRFRYEDDGPDVLENISFSVSPGEVVGVVGASGSGKTSLLRLIHRIYVPKAGRVLVDGINIADVDPAWLRRQVGAVTQDSVLFNRSVRDNIAAGVPNMPIDTVERAAELAGADDFVRALPHAFDTVVGERGAQLSVGQRQRIALARALALEPKMLLLDEPTSALDAIAEARVQDNLTRIVRGRTVFLVAHRLSTLRICSRILALDNGRLVEDGGPDKLLAAGGTFARLKAAQEPVGTYARETSIEALD